jgi:hypothetical protein
MLISSEEKRAKVPKENILSERAGIPCAEGQKKMQRALAFSCWLECVEQCTMSVVKENGKGKRGNWRQEEDGDGKEGIDGFWRYGTAACTVLS